jgi:predicted acetylornithine/succinylornithine family transaminase
MDAPTFEKFVLKTYNREKVFFRKGKGCYLYDENKNRWLDFISGIGVTNLGHCHPKLIKTLKKQASLLWHTSNIYYIKPQGKAAELISALSFPGKTFFCNSGAEANEAAIKLCRKWGNQISPNKTKILSLTDSFHGRTMASITLTGQPKYQKGFSPLPPDFDYIETNNIKELENAINENTAALFVEAIQGEGGIRPLSAEFLKKARELTKKHNALLIFDEVQTGAGRTGKPFAYQHFDIEPDAITLAKGLGNGIPIGALHVRDQYTLLEPGEHASTFGGNFLATSVAVEVLKILQKKTFFEKVVGNCNPESGRSIQKPFSEKNPDHKY